MNSRLVAVWIAIGLATVAFVGTTISMRRQRSHLLRGMQLVMAATIINGGGMIIRDSFPQRAAAEWASTACLAMNFLLVAAAFFELWREKQGRATKRL